MISCRIDPRGAGIQTKTCRLQRPDRLADEMKSEMKQGHNGLDSPLDLWLLGHFKLSIFRLSEWASRTFSFI